MIKKIIIFTSVILFSCLQAYSVCKIGDMEACKANLDRQSQTIRDKLVPNHLDQMVNPTRDSSKEFKNVPHYIPETINMDVDSNPENSETNTPYNAACQFGVCLPGDNSNSGNIGE